MSIEPPTFPSLPLQVVIYNHMKLQAIKAKVAQTSVGKDEVEKGKGGSSGSESHTERYARDMHVWVRFRDSNLSFQPTAHSYVLAIH